jgi:uncharacterized protein YcfJ
MNTSLVKAGLVAAFVIGCAPAHADTVYLTGTVVDVDPTYTQQRVQTPYRTCEVNQVPIYGQGNMNQDGAILGGIIGGILGNQVGKGSGKEVATGVGALTGAIIGGKGNQKIIGYQNVEQCSVQYETSIKDVFVSNTVTVSLGEETLKFYSKRQYEVGQTARVKINRTLD